MMLGARVRAKPQQSQGHLPRLRDSNRCLCWQPLRCGIVVVFIAAEEGGEKQVGVDKVLEKGKLEEAKNGPVYWVDSADSNPCCGTAGVISWQLKCKGRLFHSGFPNKGINSIELAQEAIAFRFFNDFPPLPEEELYSFATGSHMKPTQIESSKGSFNQIPAETTISGDIRLSPFYEVEDVVEHVEKYVEESASQRRKKELQLTRKEYVEDRRWSKDVVKDKDRRYVVQRNDVSQISPRH
eukprot:g14836.t1